MESTLFPRECVLLLKEFGPFLGENSMLFKKVIFLPHGTFYTPWGTYLGLTLNHLFLREVAS
jgi:hypothetical protein